MESLSRSDRLQLVKFVCAFAWADLEVHDAERRFVQRLITELGLEDERAKVLEWLQTPPPTEEIDPTRVPSEHRQLFLETARQVFQADGVIDQYEQEEFDLLEQLLSSPSH